jgi:hypothetical protein
MQEAINKLKFHLDYVCYEKGMEEKLNGVLRAFHKLEEQFKKENKTTPVVFGYKFPN